MQFSDGEKGYDGSPTYDSTVRVLPDSGILEPGCDACAAANAWCLHLTTTSLVSPTYNYCTDGGAPRGCRKILLVCLCLDKRVEIVG